MPTTYGLTTEGFEPKPLEAIVADMEASQRANINPALNLSTDSVLGQVNAIVGTEIAKCWEEIQKTYKSRDPDAAEGEAQDALCALTGTTREGADFTRAWAIVELAAGFTLLAGAVARIVGDPSKRFFSLTDVVNSTGDEEEFPCEFIAEFPGKIELATGETLEIAEAQDGWTEIEDVVSVDVGRAVETASELRIRREEELDGLGSSNLGAIVAAVRKVEGVDSVQGYENVYDSTDADGRPPHSIEIVVNGGDDNAIAQAIFEAKSGGIESYSIAGDYGVATDEDGVQHEIGFSRPTDVLITVDIEVRYTGTSVDVNEVKKRIVDRGNARRVGQDALVTHAIAEALKVVNVFDVPSCALSSVLGAGSPNVAVGPRERAFYTLDNVNVSTSSDEDD